MDNLFNPDGKLMRWGTKFTDLLLLQLLTLLCCLPVFTAGASFTAMHKVLLQLRRDEESGIIRTFFRSFRENFRQATVLWLLFAVLFLSLYLNWKILTGENAVPMFKVIRLLFPTMLLLALLGFVWVFVILSRYRNSIWGTLRSAFLVGLAHPLYSLGMALLMLLPLILLLVSVQTLPWLILLGFTIPGYLQAMLYSKVFDKLETAMQEREENAGDATE